VKLVVMLLVSLESPGQGGVPDDHATNFKPMEQPSIFVATYLNWVKKYGDSS
jgi:hypothetical protein